MAKYMFLGIGSPSDKAAFEKPYLSLGNMTVNEYLKEKSIMQTKELIPVSCHRTLRRAVDYAHGVDRLAQEGHSIVTVLFGGLSFALPGIFSSETMTIPIIGVPTHSKSTHGGGLDSTTAVYNLPPGTVVGGVPLHTEDAPSLDKAILIAEKILNMESSDLTLISQESSKHTDIVSEILHIKFGIGYNLQQSISTNDRFQTALHITPDSKEFKSCDNNSYLALQCRIVEQDIEKLENPDRFIQTLDCLAETNNTLYFARPENTALFLARIISLYSPEIRQKLVEYKDKKADETEKKYGPEIHIKDMFTT